MLAEGLLVADPSAGEGVYVAGEGWQQAFDWVSFTPYIWNNSTGQFITYDDPVSLSYKREFSRNVGIQGMMIWEVDWDTTDGELIQALS
jgi:chitinase